MGLWGFMADSSAVQVRSEWGPRIKRVGISDEVICRFKDLIARGVLRPGSKLPSERELAESLGVSRPSLRQALKALQILGVIQCRQGTGCHLAGSPSELLKAPFEFALAMKGTSRPDLFEMRVTVEVSLASLAASRRTVADLEAMRRALVGMESSLDMPDKYCFYGMQFHQSISRAAGNTVMETMLEMLSHLLIESRQETVRLLTNYRESYNSHEAVFEAIERQHSEDAAAAMLQHFALMQQRAQQAWA
jgi:GntR family transcriptional regulator, transcriptional repressor for pyruvate dehydrogenase complex